MPTKDEIRDLVKEIVGKRSNLEISIAKEIFSTKFLQFDKEKQQVFADQLIPKNGNNLLVKDRSYHFRQCHFEAGMVNIVHIEAVYLQSSSINNLAAHIFSFPTNITQKSTVYEVEPKASEDITIAFVVKPVRVEEYVSSLNIRYIQFKGSIPVLVPAEGIEIENVSLILPQDEIRFTGVLKRATKYIFRLEISEIMPENFAALNRYITERYKETLGFVPKSTQRSEKERPGIAYKPKEDAPKYKGRVFIVDDQALITDMLSRVFTRNGYFCRTYNDGNNLIENAVTHKPDIIVLDIKMPDYDGITLCRRLKRDPRTSHISVVMLTGASSKEDVLEAKEAGAELYLVKSPNMDMKEMVARLDYIMENKSGK